MENIDERINEIELFFQVHTNGYIEIEETIYNKFKIIDAFIFDDDGEEITVYSLLNEYESLDLLEKELTEYTINSFYEDIRGY